MMSDIANMVGSASMVEMAGLPGDAPQAVCKRKRAVKMGWQPVCEGQQGPRSAWVNVAVGSGSWSWTRVMEDGGGVAARAPRPSE